MDNSNKWLIGGIAAVVLICLCLGAACLAVGGLAAFNFSRNTSQLTPFPDITQFDATPEQGETAVPDVPRDGDNTPQAQATVVPLGTQQPAGQEAQETLKTLEEMVVPINDPRELAQRLGGQTNIPETINASTGVLKVGAKQTFWASNTDTNDNFQVKATLRYVSDHLYFWIEDGVSYNAAALKRLGDTFEQKIYPTDRAFFGSEWTPGIDNDPHLYVLYASGLGNSIAGYFSSADSLPPQVHQYSNAHEMFMMNSDGVRLEDEYIYSVMAHEFQHMIHWYRDRNEESWMNEGFAELAAFLNGYDIGGADYVYTTDPDLQLTS